MITIRHVNQVHVRIEAERGYLQELSEYFTFLAPNAQFMPAVKNKIWDGKIRLLDLRTGKIYRGLLFYIKKFCDDRGYDCVTDKQLQMSFQKTDADIDSFLEQFKCSKEPRDYQIEALRSVVRQGGRTTLLSPTASGKSFIIYMLREFYQSKTLVIVPTTSLVEQMKGDFVEYGFDESRIVTIMAGREKTNNAEVVITTWQSAYKMPVEWFKDFDLVIGDEVHLFKSKSLCTLLEKMPQTALRVGMTGTLDGTEVHRLVIEGLFGPVYKVVSSSELIAKGTLAALDIRALKLIHPELKRRELMVGKKLAYPEEMEAIISSEARNQFIAKLASHCKGATLVLFQFVDRHGKQICDEIRRACPEREVHFVYGGTDVAERENVRRYVAEGRNPIIVASYGVFSTGINAPNLKYMILASPTKSIVRLLQSIGRLLRVSDSVQDVTMFDLADDFSWKSKRNHTLGHFQERLKIYTTEGFKFTVKDLNL